MEYKYMVCTRCFTYNQSMYIVETMNGFIMQETIFPVVNLIIDDASSDTEPIVINEYLKEHFETPFRDEETDYAHILCARHKTNSNCVFVILFLKYNHYSIKKSTDEYLSEWVNNAKYQAFCEGDDYWNDSKKLQKQVDEMEKYENVDVCAHTAVRMKNKRVHGFIRPLKKTGILSAEKIIEGGGGVVATNSLLFRTEVITSLLEFQKVQNFDYSMEIRGALRGGMLFIDECMSTYRESAINSWSSKIRKNKKIAWEFYETMKKMLDVLNEETQGRYNKTIEEKKTKISFQAACVVDNWKEIRNEKNASIFKKLPFRRKIQLYLNHYMPSLVKPVSTFVDIVFSIIYKKYSL